MVGHREAGSRDTEWLTISEASAAMNVPVARVNEMVQLGLLATRVQYGQTLVEPAIVV